MLTENIVYTSSGRCHRGTMMVSRLPTTFNGVDMSPNIDGHFSFRQPSEVTLNDSLMGIGKDTSIYHLRGQ